MVKRWSFVAVGVILSASFPLTASAQSTIELEVAAGVGGYAAPGAPLTIEVTIRPEVLFSGEIEVNSSGAVIRVPAEVAAGTSKTFSVVAPPFGGQVTRVRLYPLGAEKAIANQTLQLRVPKDELLVGVFATGSGVAGALDASQTSIAGTSVVSVALNTLDGPFEPLGYIVAGDLSQGGPNLWEWVNGGGRLVTDDVGEIPDGARAVGNANGGSLFQMGEGELLVVEDLETIDAGWAQVLRPTPISTSTPDPWSTPERALAQVASASGGSKAQSLPWLLAALLVYVVVVGPVNLVVLRRLKRREFAWVTIPAISLVTLGGFWMAGRQRLASTEMTQASVIVVNSGRVEQRSVVVLAAGRAGEHTVAFEDGSDVYPANLQFLGMGQAALGASGRVSGDEVSFDLPQLGFGAVHVLADGPALPKVSVGENGLVVDNTSPYDFWAWGVGGANRLAAAHAGVLAKGESAGIAIPGDQGFFFGSNLADQVIERLQLWNDERTRQIFYPLGEAAGYLSWDVDLYFFGYVEEYPVTVTLDGVNQVVTGPALVIIPVEQVEANKGVVSGTLLSVGKNGFVEGGGPGYVYVNSDEMYVSLRVPLDLVSDPVLGFRNDFGQIPAQFHAWDWQLGELVDVGTGAGLDRTRYVSATGEVIVRAGNVPVDQEVEDDFDKPLIGMTPSLVTLHWERA